MPINMDFISSKVAKDIGMNEEKVKRINRVQWRFLSETMQSGNFETVNIFYLGKFKKNKRYDNPKSIKTDM